MNPAAVSTLDGSLWLLKVKVTEPPTATTFLLAAKVAVGLTLLAALFALLGEVLARLDRRLDAIYQLAAAAIAALVALAVVLPESGVPERGAFVYVRQSSLRQVRNNLESQRLQYGFAEQAAQLGWSRERIVIIDEDQGQSGALPQSRGGFGGMVAAVARGEVGIVMSFELSRLSRNDLDWHHLVYLCRWTNTLIADEQGLYDPSSSADRMVLGIRGQVSELERDSIVHRMVEARWNKARRGEAFTIPPAGYELDDLGRLQFSSDEAVQAALRRVFEKFDELGAARQIFLWWRSEGRIGYPSAIFCTIQSTRARMRSAAHDRASRWSRGERRRQTGIAGTERSGRS